jgi:hypothetical protein
MGEIFNTCEGYKNSNIFHQQQGTKNHLEKTEEGEGIILKCTNKIRRELDATGS